MNVKGAQVQAVADLEEYVVPDAYMAWVESEGVRLIKDFAFEDLRSIELTPWERKGGDGAVINIPNQYLPNDAHLVQLRPGRSSEPEHHLYEELVYVLEGRGATRLWVEEGEEESFEWQAGSLFAIPVNAWYQHFNGSGSMPARYIAMTTAPPILRQFRNAEFVFNNPFRFAERFSAGSYFSGPAKLYQKRIWATNFVPNAASLELFDRAERGAGGANAHLEMASNSTQCHISQFPVGTYKKAHRHGPGAHLIILGGQGYSLLWQDGEERRICRWQLGAMIIVPTEDCIHQHFNTGPVPARYLALQAGHHGLIDPVARRSGRAGRPMEEGGWQIEYEDEDPEVHALFEAELKANGAPCLMKRFLPDRCTGN